MNSVAENIVAARARIESAALRCGRDPKSIALMAVCKTQPASEIRAAYNAGQRLFGENRVQEFREKSVWLRDITSHNGNEGAEFHLIGHLQSNKTNPAVELFHAVDAVDSLYVLERLNLAAQRLNKVIPVLVEINVGGEEQKAGVPPGSTALNEILLAGARLTAIKIRGLMTVPPYTEDPEGARSHFRALRELRDQIASRKIAAVEMEELSMGMSHDFEVAIEEGSTCVRIGTAIFGARNYA